MCSIAGLWDPNRICKFRLAFAVAALIHGRDRGRHSAGIVAARWRRKVGDPVLLAKELVYEDVADSEAVLCHTRWASVGEINFANAHPIKVGRDAYIVHNGTVAGDILIPHWRYVTTTDTERLGVALHRLGPYAGAKCFQGWAAVAIWDRQRRRLLVWRDGAPLYAVIKRKPFVVAFASTKPHLEAALRAGGLQDFPWDMHGEWPDRVFAVLHRGGFATVGEAHLRESVANIKGGVSWIATK